MCTMLSNEDRKEQMRFRLVYQLTFGGRFAMSTMSVCNTAFENRGPTGVQSKRRSMLSTTTTLIGLFELSANTFEIAWIFCASEKPTILSGVMSLMNGNSDAWAIVAASAVLPVPGGP